MLLRTQQHKHTHAYPSCRCVADFTIQRQRCLKLNKLLLLLLRLLVVWKSNRTLPIENFETEKKSRTMRSAAFQAMHHTLHKQRKTTLLLSFIHPHYHAYRHDNETTLVCVHPPAPATPATLSPSLCRKRLSLPWSLVPQNNNDSNIHPPTTTITATACKNGCCVQNDVKVPSVLLNGRNGSATTLF